MIRPEPPDAKERYRFNWNSPILISPHDPRTVYYGGNRLFGSKDRGDNWTLVTPDLTHAAERDSLTIFGKPAQGQAVPQRRRRPLGHDHHHRRVAR